MSLPSPLKMCNDMAGFEKNDSEEDGFFHALILHNAVEVCICEGGIYLLSETSISLIDLI